MQSDQVEPPIQLAPVALADLTWQRFGKDLNAYQNCLGVRLWVPGGWLVRTSDTDDSEAVFVPDPTHTWDTQYAIWQRSSQ